MLWSNQQIAPAFGGQAGGEATLGEIFTASLAQARYVDNLNAAQAAMEEVYRRHGEAVFALTGEKLPNPMLGASSDPIAMATLSHYDDRRMAYMRRLDELAGRHPDTAQWILPQTSFEEQALSLTRETEARFSLLAGSRDGAAKWISLLAGGIAGSARDPLQVATWIAGGGIGGARTVAGRILTVAASEAAVNAGVELAMQPIVQRYRARAGLDAGIEEALQNAGMAGLMAGALGLAGRSIVEALTLGGRSGARAARASLPNVPARDPVRAAMEADIAEALPAVRAALPAPARGAVDAMAVSAHMDAIRPADALPDSHDGNIAKAHRILDADPLDIEERGLRFEPDPAQIERIADAMTGPTASPSPAARSLVGFLIDRGGLKDFQGELAALGADAVAERFRGRLVRPDGLALDHAREIAEEAGYIGRAGEAQTTTVADLLDALDQELRGNPVLSRADAEAQGSARAAQAERAAVESAVAEVASFAGPGVQDRIVREAAELMLTDGLDAGDALERVLVRMEDAGDAVDVGRSGEPLPGWSDAELMEAGAARGLPPDASAGGIDNPAPARLGDGEEFTVTPAELEEFGSVEIVGDDGQPVSLARFLEEAQRLDDEAALIAACRML